MANPKLKYEVQTRLDGKSKATFNDLKTRISAVSVNFAALSIVALGTFATIAKKSIDAADKIAKTADATGFGTDQFQSYSFAASQAGVSQESLSASLERFTKRIGEAADGTGAAKTTYERLGIAVRNQDGKIRDSNAVLRDVADAMKNMDTQAERAAATAALFGREGVKLTNLFKGGSDALDHYADQARELGLVIEEDLLRNSEKAADQLDIVSKIISIQVTASMINLAPTITKVGHEFVDLTKKIREANAGFKTFGGDPVFTPETFIQGSKAELEKRLKQVTGNLELLAKKESAGFLDKIKDSLFLDATDFMPDKEFLDRLAVQLRASIDNLNTVKPKKIEPPSATLDNNIIDLESEKIKRILELQQGKFTNLHEMALQANNQSIELENLRHSRDVMRLEEDFEQLRSKGLITAEIRSQFDEAEADALTAHIGRLNNINRRAKKDEEDVDKKSWHVKLALAAGSTNRIISATSSGSKKLFKIQKSLALAQAAVALPSAVIQSFENAGGYPWGILPAAAMLAEGLAQISSIKSSSFSGGGSSRSISSGGSQSATPTISTPQLPDPSLMSQNNKNGVVVHVSFLGDFHSFESSESVSEKIVEVFKRYVDADGILITTGTAQAQELNPG